uniref:Uncharacterized protein n=2 Tax=Clytia hemisphaerica TaxID=252671 RepID=A0A7M5UR98_9CNID
MALATIGESTTSLDIWTLSKNGICNACLDGRYESCYCVVDKKKKSKKSASKVAADTVTRENLISSGSYSHSCSGEFISDNEFEDYVDLEGSLPVSSTDWNTIDTLLTPTKERQEMPSSESTLTALEMCSPEKKLQMQMTFVDSESDKESIPDVEVYYEDNQDFLFRKGQSISSTDLTGPDADGRNIDSRDSGFVTSDMYEHDIEYVTDDVSEKRRGSLEPSEISHMMLTTLQLHEESEERERKERESQSYQQNEYKANLFKKSFEELTILKEELEIRVAEINLELVQELSLRDELHSHHQALLMNADDIAKSAPCPNNNDVTPTNSPSKTVSATANSNSTATDNRAKRRSWWFR